MNCRSESSLNAKRKTDDVPQGKQVRAVRKNEREKISRSHSGSCPNQNRIAEAHLGYSRQHILGVQLPDYVSAGCERIWGVFPMSRNDASNCTTTIFLLARGF